MQLVDRRADALVAINRRLRTANFRQSLELLHQHQLVEQGMAQDIAVLNRLSRGWAYSKPS